MGVSPFLNLFDYCFRTQASQQLTSFAPRQLADHITMLSSRVFKLMERKSFIDKVLRSNMVLEIPSHDSSVACIRDNLQDVPKMPGCYLIWRSEELIYVGVSGKVWTKDNPKTSHLNQRLSDHFRGTKSDVFPIKVFEGFGIDRPYVAQKHPQNGPPN